MTTAPESTTPRDGLSPVSRIQRDSLGMGKEVLYAASLVTGMAAHDRPRLLLPLKRRFGAGKTPVSADPLRKIAAQERDKGEREARSGAGGFLQDKQGSGKGI